MSLSSIVGTKKPRVASNEVNESLPLTRTGHNNMPLEVLNISRSAHELRLGKPLRRSLEAGLIDVLAGQMDSIDALCSGRRLKSLLGYRRHECINQIHWDLDRTIADANLSSLDREHFQPYAVNCLEILECWSYDGVTTVKRDHNFRLMRLDDGSQQVKPDEFKARLERWLKRQGQYQPLKPKGAGTLKGGIRLVMCDRPNAAARMTISRDAFEAIEAEFHLHEATLPAFLKEAGSLLMHRVNGQNEETTKVQIVLKVVQHMEISNCLLSLTYDVASNWTDAFICGDGIIFERICDRGH
ncbi:hypothetical protein CLCR_03626 [Cladophialophora carrionii]|uniref:Uncharacterized protein n=1 Tax=Cladophialophora carrionii TaxID=86049 RepID=A0A1C1CGG0_9EURO|nr:hypothetical protein CLCR_03626 [Cladophialophora carrionii]